MSETTQGIDPTIANDDLSDTQLPTVVVKDRPSRAPGRASELLGQDAGAVNAGSVSMEHSGAESIDAERVDVSNSGIRNLNARSAQIDQSGILLMKSERAVLQESSAVAISATEIRLANSTAVLVHAENVTMEPGARVVIAIGGNPSGAAPMFSTMGAAALGGALGLVLLVLGRMPGRGKRRSSRAGNSGAGHGRL